MSASQDSSQKFHEYDSEDRQLLVNLLHEYSDKLVEASREVARKKAGISAGEIITFIPCFIFSCSFSYLFWTVMSSYMEINLESTYSQYSSIIILSTAILLFPIVLLFFIRTNLFYSFSLSKQSRLQKIENDLLEKDARMIANRLESAMRLTVEIADRVETNLARKLELDLRIDDAASALEYYHSVVNLKSKSQSKSRKVAS